MCGRCAAVPDKDVHGGPWHRQVTGAGTGGTDVTPLSPPPFGTWLNTLVEGHIQGRRAAVQWVLGGRVLQAQVSEEGVAMRATAQV